MKNTLTIGIVGAGGDGVVAIGSFLQHIAAARGYFSQMPRYYGAQIRGGGSAVKISLDAEALCLPRDTLDLLVCFQWEKYLEVRHELHLGSGTLVIYEKDPPEDIDLPENTFRIAFTEESNRATNSSRNKNLIALGLLLSLIGFDGESVTGIVRGDAELHLVSENWSAIEAGMKMPAGISVDNFELSPPKDKSPKIILNGNAAAGKGAIRAGCRAYYGYPITPAAEIMQEMEKGLAQVSGVFLQTEDEISSAGLLVGASMTGIKAMTGTSGPGLDLMTETLGLAVAAEIPLVIIDVQRGGPSTGIPSKSEQSDLNHAIYGGHGDAPRVVMAPYDVEGCYRLTVESFNIAESLQVPVIVLSDQWLGQTFVAINGDFLDADYTLVERKKPIVDAGSPYHRYRMTDDLVSPMSDAGDPGLIYQTSGLTHNEDGAPAFDAETHYALHQKRYRKLSALVQRDDLVTILGDESSVRGIITWGSSMQIVRDTVSFLGLEDGIRICAPELLYPLPQAVKRFAQSVEKLLIVEMNYSGQLYCYLRSQIDLPRNTQVYCRPGGRPFSRRELSEPIQGLIQNEPES